MLGDLKRRDLLCLWVCFGAPGLLFSHYGTKKKGGSTKHPVPLHQGCGMLGRHLGTSLGRFGKHPTLGNLSMCFFPFSPCSKTCGVDKQEKLLGLVLLSTPRGCTQLQHPKFLLALGRGVQHPNKGGFGVGRSSATPLTLLALLCSYRKRRGAINSKQLTYLEKYRPKQRLRFKDPHNHKNKCCIM